MGPFPIAAAATVLSGHHNKEDAIAVLKVKLALILSIIFITQNLLTTG